MFYLIYLKFIVFCIFIKSCLTSAGRPA